MTKKDLVHRITIQTGLRQADVSRVIQYFFDQVINELSAGRGIELRNFAVFSVERRKKRVGRNPHRPEKDIPIPERYVVKFKPGKVMKTKLSTFKERQH